MSFVAGMVCMLLLLMGAIPGQKRRRGNHGGFSMRRLLGVSTAKRRLGRAIGIPLSRSGRQAAIGRMFGVR